MEWTSTKSLLWISAHAVAPDRLTSESASASAKGGAVHEAVGELRRVSVYADAVHVDLALPAAAPVGSLIPPIVDILPGEYGHRGEPVAARYQLSLPGHVAFDPSKTLAQIGIRDGTALILTSSSTELTIPRFDDAAEAVSMSLGTTARPWTRWAARLAGAMAGSWLAGAGAVVLIRGAFDGNDAQRIDGAGVAATVAAVALLAAAVGSRAFGDRIAGLTLGMTASGFAAVAGLLVVPGGPGAPNALLAAMAAAATSIVTMHVTGCCTVAFTALSGFAAVAAAAATVSAVTAAPLHAIGAISAAISLGLLEASARVSIMLAGLSPRLASDLKAATEDPAPAPHRLSAKAIRADSLLTSLVLAFSASAGLGGIGAAVGACSASGPRLLDIMFATITGVVLLLRARSHGDLARSAPLVVSGTATLSATFVVAASAYPLHASWIAAAAALLAIAAPGLGLIRPAMAISPVGRRGIELLEYLALAAIVPLACWICGLYSAARGWSLS
jgi:type VII secretion integral membrane protein EccD